MAPTPIIFLLSKGNSFLFIKSTFYYKIPALYNIFLFLKSPFIASKKQYYKSYISFAKSIMLFILILVFVGVIRYLFSQINLLNGFRNITEQNNANILGIIKKRGVTVAFLFISVFVPFIEELIFRRWLSFKRNHVFLSLLAFIIYIPFSFSTTSLFILITFLFFSPIIYLLYINTTKETLNYFKSKYGVFTFHAMAFLFTILHLKNLAPLSNELIIEYIVFLTPNYAYSLITSYISIRSGFIFSVFFHIAINSLSFIALYNLCYI